MRSSAAAVLAGVITLTMIPRGAHAASDSLIIKSNDEHKSMDLSFLFHAIWYGGVGTGVRIGIPVAPRGFIPKLNDQVKIELGASFQNWWTWHVHPVCNGDHVGVFFRMAMPVLLRWDFFLTNLVTVYGGIGVEIGVPFHRDPDVASCLRSHPSYVYGWATFAAQMGILLNFHDNVSLRMQFSHTGFDIGIEFRLGKV